VGYSDYPIALDTKALASGEGHYREVVGCGGESATLMQRQERQLQLLGETVAALRSKLEKERKDHKETKNALSEAESSVRDSKASLAETQRENMKVSLANTEILKASSVFVRQVEDELDQVRFDHLGV
jgi:ribosomal protein S15P/S13E